LAGNTESYPTESPLRFRIKIKDLEYRRIKHGIDPDQAHSQASRSTDDLIRYDPDDPIRGDTYWVGNEEPGEPARGLQVMGGHHRLQELHNRYLEGIVDGDLEVEVQYERWQD
jgi:hypothetical protein